jgi:hypothetical protein
MRSQLRSSRSGKKFHIAQPSNGKERHIKVSSKRKLSVFEIGSGKLGKELQDEFEQATITACERNSKVSVSLKITVFPPSVDNFGRVSYALKTTPPTRESIEYETEVDNGLIIASAPLEVGVLQERLQLPGENNSIPFTNESRL